MRRVPSPNRYMAVAKFCFCKNNKRSIDRAREYKPFCCLLVLLLLLLLLLLASQPIIRRTFSACVCFVTFVSVYLCA